MPKNFAFLLVSLFIGLCATFYTVKSVQEFYHFWRLDKKVPLEALSFKTHEINEEKYTLIVDYSYLQYNKVAEITTPLYKNPYAAEEGAKKMFREMQSLWIDSSNPSISALTKEISYKNFAYTFILWGLALYFLFLNKALIK